MTQPPATERAILIVDDEVNVINAVKRELHGVTFAQQPLVVEGFTDPKEALARAEEKAFDLVISDYRMPEMDGLEFLKAYAAIQPDSARLVLSGQTDFTSLTRMINETHIYRFIPKPWTEYFLKSSLFQALRLRDVLRENQKLAGVVRRHDLDTSALLPPGRDLILIVDDDVNVLNSLSRDLTHHSSLDDIFSSIRSSMGHRHPGAKLEEDKISIQISTSPLHALKMADAVSFSCIIADYRMPEMDGITLLEKFMDAQPDCERILISGEASTENLVNALDLAHIFSYIGKPWVDFEVKTSVAQALQHRRIVLENRILAEMLRAKDINLVQ